MANRIGKGWLISGILLLSVTIGGVQYRREYIYSDFVFYKKGVGLEKDLRERMIGRNFSLPLDSNTEDKYLSSCWAVSQFLFASPEVERGFTTLFGGYDSLCYDTKKALLEAVYAVDPGQYMISVQAVLEKETDPKLFSMCAAYLFRADTTTESGNRLKIRMTEKFPGYDTLAILQELQNYLSYHTAYRQGKTPDISALFTRQRRRGQKVIYFFQRWDRDYPGLAMVHNAAGRFVRVVQTRAQTRDHFVISPPHPP